jgi:protein required for attachment to host cells
MTTTWILVAHNAGARCFENGGPGKGIELIEEIGHPEGRQSEGELQADRPGRSFQRNSGDTRRSAMSPPQSAQERIVADFDRLVLVAPPKLLGLLRSALDAPTAHCVVGSLDKNLAMSDQDELVKHLGEVIAV